MKQLKVAVLGGGSWGTTVASLVARNTDVIIWARDADTVAEINDQPVTDPENRLCTFRT